MEKKSVNLVDKVNATISKEYKEGLSFNYNKNIAFNLHVIIANEDSIVNRDFDLDT